jgi:hypothetical protein
MAATEQFTQQPWKTGDTTNDSLVDAAQHAHQRPISVDPLNRMR